ncbi:MucR family transcriptional regulator [Paracoccus versutus]
MPEKSGLIQCLECQRWFRSIGSHLIRAHGMTAREYRERWDLPASHKLASDDLRAAQSIQTKRMIAAGTMNNDPIAASEAARHAGRGRKTKADLARQAEIARAIPHEMIPDGGKRADGKDAKRTREYQRAYRARKKAEASRNDP